MATAIDKKIVPDFDDDTHDIGANDDEIKDDEADQRFDEELNREFEQGTIVLLELEESPPFDDDEEKDSGIGESDTTDIEEKPLITRPIIVPPSRVVGRGQYGKKAVDEWNKELPEPGFHYVEPEKGYYSKYGRKSTLPASYYRKREDPEIQNQRRALRASSPLIDFKTEFTQISFIADKDDSKEKGYQHACRRLQQIKPDLEIDSSKSQYDIWSFGLYIYPMTFKDKVSCSLLDLIPEKINNEENRPFWFMFKCLPTFQDSKLRDRTPKHPDAPRGTSILMKRAIYADLSYGALTSMTRFCVHKDYIFYTRSKWSLYFHEEFFEIQTIQFQGLKDNASRNLIQVKYKIPLDIIDRAAIIQLRNDGFSLFLNMKGNIHELHREYIPKPKKDVNTEPSTDVNTEPFIRQGIRNNKPMPLFSTIRIRIRLRDDQQINDLLEREGKILKNTPSNEKDDLVKKTREDALDQIREIFKNFLDFFYKNRIHVCFGPIYQKSASLEHLCTLDCHIFPSFIQEYSWAMLCNIVFRLQMQLFLSKTFITRLHDYSEPKYDNEKHWDINDRFYRLCLYLHRRSSEYFFSRFR